ncbi:MAG: hypothetical protein EPO02_07950 [Nitrospirae bacterium]|nr:MAG: hypothetical protein EPO02_07950 [Nitrospirota bacterium]
MKRSWKTKVVLASLGFLATVVFMLPLARAVSMADYTWTPLFMQNNVPPNILFIVDYSDGMLPAAYGNYPLSYNNASSYSSNYSGTGLTGTVSDTFDPTHNYYGLFDPLRCYVPASPKGFGPPSTGAVLKTTINSTCASTSPWDGNFLNWLSMRKVDVAKKALIGGQSLSASNTDGTADKLLGEQKTGLNGSTNTCNSTSDQCWRYVKFVRHDLLQGRIDTTLETADTAWTSGSTAPSGPGQVTASGSTVTAYLGAGPTTFTTTFAAGDIIKIGTNVPKNVTAVTDAQHLTFSPSAFSPDITNATTYTRYFPKTGVTYPGSVSVTSGSTAVTGSSSSTPTTFTSSFSTGSADAIQIRSANTNSDPIQLVSTITDATHLTAGVTFGTIATATPYTIFKPSGASAPGTVSTLGTAVTGTGVTSSTNFSNTFVTGDAIIANPGTGAEAQNVSAIGSTTGLTTSLAFSSNVPLNTTYSLKAHGPGTSASFSNNSISVSGTGATTFNTSFVLGDLIRIGTASAIVSATPSSATALTITKKAGANLTSSYTVYKAPSATTGSGTASVAASGTITGSGTAFTTTFQLGDLVKIGSQVQTISTLTSATSMKTDTDFPTTSSTNYSYYYAAGTVAVTAGSNTVTGTGTSFTTTLTVGDMIWVSGVVGGQAATVSKIASNTSLTTTTNFATSVSSQHYTPFTQTSTTTGPGTVSSASTSVSGSTGTVSTSFTTTFATGDAIKVGTEVQIVNTVISDTSLTTYNAFGVANANASYAKLVSSGVSGAGTGPASVTASGTAVTGVATVTSTTFTTTFAVGDIIKITASSEPKIITVITDNTNMTVDSAVATSATGSAYTAFSSDSAVQPGTVTTASTTAVGSSASTPTTFLSTFAVGDQIQIGAQTRTITAITDNFTLTVGTAYAPDITTPSSYSNVGNSLSAPGTVTNTAGSTTVTGTGTNFTSRLRVGESIKIGTETKIIATITSDTVLTTTTAITAANAGAAYFGPNGIYFGSGEGTIYVNGDATPVPFDAAAARQYQVQVDVSPVSGDANQTSAYQKTQSLGFIQTFRTDGMRAAVMFTNASNGKAGSIVQYFDGNFNSSDITNIRNQHISTFAALAESTYEGLCYYRNSQGACYNNSPADWTASVGASGDPYFFVSSNQTVSCCKSFILMISAGIPSGDGNAPDRATPFSGMFTGTDTLGVSDTVNGWLDNVAYYGNTHDVRNQGTGVFGDVPNTQNVVFYSVNAMGGQTGATLLASASKYGGFTDQNADGLPDAGTQTCTYPTGSNLGSGTGVSSPEWDTNKDCTPDTYFDASEGGDLQGKINDAIAAILKRASSGTSVSVLATSSTGEGAIYQAYFLPETTKGDGTTDLIKWLGFTQGLFIDTFGNIREDSDRDGRLVLTNDKIITLSFDTTTNTVAVLRCPDADGDGKADSTAVPPCSNVLLSDIQPIWEAGKRLAYLDPGTSCTIANAGASCRRILTWLDANNNKLVDSGEVKEFTVGNMASICPYLGGTSVATCSTSSSAGQTEATNLINFHRGADGVPLGLRDRSSKVFDPDNLADSVGAQKVWKLGDVVDATPTVVAAPKERYDVIYGDTTYTTFFTQYKNRRQVAYVGANDGMMHAINAGFFNSGDDPCTTPVEHGYFTVQPFANNPHTVSQCSYATTARTSNPKLGAELWAYIPQALLPHLKWYADNNYTHVAYVDLKPKITDVRIFCGDTAAAPNGSPSTCITGQSGTGTHPGGWGTILIGGMRFGGSCGACTSGANNGGPPMTVTAEFVSGTTSTRTFYAVYFVLDITDPEQDPVLLWSFTDARMGLTMSYPAVLRVSPPADVKTDPANARWLVVFGTGATGYTGISTQTSQFFVVDIAKGPTYSSDVTTGSVGQTSCSTSTPCVVVSTSAGSAGGENVRAFSTGDTNSFMGDLITLDSNLDFRVDVIYAGNVITGTTPTYIGKMYRLTTTALDTAAGTPTTVGSWGITSSGAQVPTRLLITTTSNSSTSTCASSVCKVGPITAASTVSADTSNNIWVFFGSGRFLSNADKSNTDQQYFYGVKDPCATSSACTQTTTSQSNNLLDVSNAVVCNPCATGTNEVTGVGGTNGDLGQVQSSVQNIDGWFMLLPNSGERSLSTPTILGGTVFFTTFIPTTDICVAAGSGNLYALYYLTGTAYKESVIGTTTSGGTTTIKRSIGLGTGLPSQMAVQIGAEGSGSSGSSGSGSGCAGRVTGFIQASTGVLGSVCGKPALSSWSRMLSWRDL